MYPGSNCTVDTLRGFKLKLIQPATGFRFSVDALLLAYFVSQFQADTAVEIGCGCGVVSLVAARRSSPIRAYTLLEIQVSLANLAKQNVAANPVAGVRFHVRNEDARYAMLREPVDLVFSNPPFHDPKAGRVSPGKERAVARHWFRLRPTELAAASVRMLKPDGRLVLVVPYGGRYHWVDAMDVVGMKPTECIHVRSRVGERPALVLLAFAATGVRCKTSELILFDAGGEYTETAQEILGRV